MLQDYKKLLLLTLLLLSGCASKSLPTSSGCPEIPPSPTLHTPRPSEMYSESVQKLLQRWEQRLKDTQTMP